jgi:GT2 family glycosyltransferase
VVIVNYNGGAHLARAVEGLARQSFGNFEAVIVDNESADGSADRLALPDARFRLMRAGRNLGFAAGCNLGARGAATPWLAMLNPDAVPEPDWLEALRAATMRRSDTALFGSTQLMGENAERLDGAGDFYSIFGIAWRGGYGASKDLVREDIPAFSPCAAAGLYRRDVWEALGGMAERFFCYLEDVDIGFRARLAGHRVIQVAGARVAHAGSAISGRHSRFTLYHSARNGIFMQIRCMPMGLLFMTLPLYVAAQCYLSLRSGPPTARLSGLLAGLAAAPSLMAERRTIQKGRISTRAVARLLAWSPGRLSRREIVPLADR